MAEIRDANLIFANDSSGYLRQLLRIVRQQISNKETWDEGREMWKFGLFWNPKTWRPEPIRNNYEG